MSPFNIINRLPATSCTPTRPTTRIHKASTPFPGAACPFGISWVLHTAASSIKTPKISKLSKQRVFSSLPSLTDLTGSQFRLISLRRLTSLRDLRGLRRNLTENKSCFEILCHPLSVSQHLACLRLHISFNSWRLSIWSAQAAMHRPLGASTCACSFLLQMRPDLLPCASQCILVILQLTLLTSIECWFSQTSSPKSQLSSTKYSCGQLCQSGHQSKTSETIIVDEGQSETAHTFR